MDGGSSKLRNGMQEVNMGLCVSSVSFLGFLGFFLAFSDRCAHTSGASRGFGKVVWSWSLGGGVMDVVKSKLRIGVFGSLGRASDVMGKWDGGIGHFRRRAEDGSCDPLWLESFYIAFSFFSTFFIG